MKIEQSTAKISVMWSVPKSLPHFHFYSN